MLTRGEDCAHQQPSLTKTKLRALELTAGAQPRTKKAAGVWSTNRAIRDAERELAEQAEASYKRMVTLASRIGQEIGRVRDTGARIKVGSRRAKPLARSVWFPCTTRTGARLTGCRFPAIPM